MDRNSQTIPYLALQVREAGRLLLADVHQNRTERNIGLFARLGNPMLLGAMRKSHAGSELSEDEGA